MNSFVALLCVLIPLAVQAQDTYAPDFDCSHLNDGNYPDPGGMPANCNKFYWACTHHSAKRMDCQAGLWYDPDLNLCDSRENIVACGGQKPVTKLPAPDAVTLDPTIFDCSENEDGYYPNPKDKCSETYYGCSGGVGTELHCQPGLIFDPEDMVCEKPESTFACTGTRPPPVVTEAPATYAPPQTYAMDCTDMPDGSHPHPTEKCSQEFFICSNGHVSLIKCGGKMFYDETIQRCESWRNVFACSGLQPEPKPDPVTYAPLPPKPRLDLDCTGLPDGPYPDPKNPCSMRYFDCSNGDAHERTCPHSLLWNAEELICDGFDNIFACTGVHKVTTTTLLPETSPPRVPLFDCKADGFYADPNMACSDTYFVCSGGIDSKMSCHDGLKFNIETAMCDYFDNIFACSGQRPQPTYAPAVTSDHRDVPDLPVDCSSAADGDYQDPHNACSQIYYSCSGGVATKGTCGDGLYFDAELGRCDNHDDIPVCSGNARTYPAPTEAPHTIEEHPFDCSRLADGNYPAGDCESFYWTCTGGSTNIQQCVAGLKYDSVDNLCDSEDQITSCGGQRTVPPSPDQTYNSAPVLPIDCTTLADGMYTDPASDCSGTYYVCSNGRASDMHCAGALKFDIMTKLCALKVHVPACNGGKPAPAGYQPAPPTPAAYQPTVPTLPSTLPDPQRRTAKKHKPRPTIADEIPTPAPTMAPRGYGSRTRTLAPPSIY